MRDLIEDIGRLVETGEAFSLATVVRTWKSAPRAAGAAMAVLQSGEVLGSVSGGCVEGAVYDVAQEVLARGEPQLEHYGVSDDDAFSVGLTCGGMLDVFVEHVSTSTWPALPEVLASVREREPVAVVTTLRGQATVGSKLTVWADRSAGSLGDARLDASVTQDVRGMLESGRTGLSHYGPQGERLGDDLTVFVQSFAPAPRMVLVGAVDLTTPLDRFGRFLGYDVTVCDAGSADACLESVQVGASTVICILAQRPEELVVRVLAAALTSPALYVGAMDAEDEPEGRLASLREAGVTPEQLDRLHMPMGLPIGAGTAQERTVAIVAEVVASCWGGSAQQLRETAGAVHADHRRVATT